MSRNSFKISHHEFSTEMLLEVLLMLREGGKDKRGVREYSVGGEGGLLSMYVCE